MDRAGWDDKQFCLGHVTGPCLFITYRKISGREQSLECILSWRHKQGSASLSPKTKGWSPAENHVSELGSDSLPAEPPDETPATGWTAGVRPQAEDPVKLCVDS